jgi:cell division protein FtsI/penicillin-binding protein 2
LLAAVLLLFSYLAENLLRMQVLHSAAADTTMQGYYAQDVAAPQIQKPPRGMIVDDNGRPLVSTVTVYKLAASPPYVKKKALTARTLTDVLFPLRLPKGAQAHDKKAVAKAHAAYRKHYEAILGQLKRSRISYVCLAGDDSPTCPAHFAISQAVKDVITARLNKLGLPGVTTEPRYEPSYPNGGLAAQDLGFVTYQYQNGEWVDWGQYGVQEYYNNLLSGVPGRVSVRVDTIGQPIRLGAGADAAPQQGATLRMTVDGYVQLLIEQELAQVMQSSRAESGTIIVERPSDGAILAMASAPSYNPNNWRLIVNKKNQKGKLDRSGFGVFVNPAVSKQYEPGSTFKAFTVAIGLDSGSFGPLYARE